jgi:hypothetical protein
MARLVERLIEVRLSSGKWDKRVLVKIVSGTGVAVTWSNARTLPEAATAIHTTCWDSWNWREIGITELSFDDLFRMAGLDPDKVILRE